jgi:hypothetical protein
LDRIFIKIGCAKALGTSPNLVTPGAGRTLERRPADNHGSGSAVPFVSVK